MLTNFLALQTRLFGTECFDSRIVQTILVSIPENFEASITSLENTKDLSKISLAKLVSAMQAQEQRSKMKDADFMEGALMRLYLVFLPILTSAKCIIRSLFSPKRSNVVNELLVIL